MRLVLSFKGAGEGYVSRIHPGIRWTYVVISRDRKLTTTDVPSSSLFGIRLGTLPRELCTSGDSERKGRE